jgi:hypothetical protein
MSQGLHYTLGLNTGGFMSGISQAMSGLGRFGLAMDGIGSALRLAEGAAGFLSKPIKLAASFESTQMAIRTIVGDLKTADALLAKVEKYADSTSFEFPELASATKMLLSFGVAAGDVQTELGRMGDLAAGVGVPLEQLVRIFGQAKAAQALTGGDMMQLTSAGINGYGLVAEIIGKTQAETRKLGEDGKLSFSLLQEGFRRLTSEGGKFYGMTQKQSETTAGRFSTLMDGVNRLYRQLGEPINDALRPLMKDLNENLLPQVGNSMQVAILGMKQAAADGQIGDVLYNAMGNGLARVSNLGEGTFNWLSELLSSGMSMAAHGFAAVFSSQGLDAALSIADGLGKMFTGLGDLIRSNLGEPFREIASAFQAGLTIGIMKLQQMFGALEGELPSYKDLANDFYEQNDPKKLAESGDKNTKEGSAGFLAGLKDEFKAILKPAISSASLPQFKMGTSSDGLERVTRNNLLGVQADGQAELAKKQEANRAGDAALKKTETSQVQLDSNLAAGIAAATAGPEGGEKASMATDGRRRIRGYSQSQAKPRASGLDFLNGFTKTFDDKTKTWSVPVRMSSPLDYLKGKGLQGFGGAVKRISSQGRDAATGIAEEGARSRVVARVASRNDRRQPESTPEAGLLKQLVSAVTSMQKTFDSKIGVA